MDLPAHQVTMTVLMTSDTANFSSKVHGGAILKLLDQVAYACASRYAEAEVRGTTRCEMERKFAEVHGGQ
jgi:acyl-CoA hydrolase